MSHTGKQQARADWEAHNAKYRVVGRLASELPQLAEGRVFYTISTGGDGAPEQLAACDSYNEELDALVEKYGVPEWSPAPRVPSRAECLSVLASLGGNPADVLASLKESRSVEWILGARERRGVSSLSAAIDSAKRVALVGGDVSSRAGDVDIVDLETGHYMRNYQYRRKHHPVFPWD